MTLMKALVPSTILTLIISAIVGSSGANGGFLNLQSMTVSGYSFYWSWTFFMAVMVLNCCIVMQMAKDLGD